MMREPDTTEVVWHKSSYSNGSGGNCVEVAAQGDALFVRDSKRPGERALAFAGGAWAAFVTHVGDHTGRGLSG